MTLKAIKVLAEFQWGFSVRVAGTSAASLVYSIPPPTTLVGAFMKALAQYLTDKGVSNLGESYLEGHRLVSSAEKARKIIKAATARYIPETTVPLDHGDILRMERGPYTRWKDDISRWFGISAFGKVYYPRGLIEIIYVIDLREIEKVFKVKLEDKDLFKALWNITWIGSKEGIVTVKDVELGSIEPVVTITKPLYHYFPKVAILEEGISGSYIITMMPRLDVRAYTFGELAITQLLEEYIIPAKSLRPFIPDAVYVTKLSNSGIAYKCAFRGEEIFVIWRK